MHASRHDAIVFGLQPRPLIVGHGVLSQSDGLANLASDRIQLVDEILWPEVSGATAPVKVGCQTQRTYFRLKRNALSKENVTSDRPPDPQIPSP